MNAINPAGVGRAQTLVLRMMTRLRLGSLLLTVGGVKHSFGHGQPVAHLWVHDEAVFGRVLASGDIGLGEAYMQGLWTTPELVPLLELLMRNREALEDAVYGTWWGTMLARLNHAMRRNTRSGSRKNIQAHYDLGNDFYALWLDESLTYSSAQYVQADEPLEQAQVRKIDSALDMAGVGAYSHVLEVGSGWGALSRRAAQRGAKVRSITLSQEQLAHCKAQAADLGLEPSQLHYALQDYREAPSTGTYDAIVSIEMLEAVGQAYWPSYFHMLDHCLKPGGAACIQTIVIRDDLFERYARTPDFIQRYVFPGGMLPSRSQFEAHAQAAGFHVVQALDFGPSYALTLREWRLRFHHQLDAIRTLGHDETFIRLWDFYLAYCEAAFTTGNTSVMQFKLCKSQVRTAPMGKTP